MASGFARASPDDCGVFPGHDRDQPPGISAIVAPPSAEDRGDEEQSWWETTTGWPPASRSFGDDVLGGGSTPGADARDHRALVMFDIGGDDLSAPPGARSTTRWRSITPSASATSWRCAAIRLMRNGTAYRAHPTRRAADLSVASRPVIRIEVSVSACTADLEEPRLQRRHRRLQAKVDAGQQYGRQGVSGVSTYCWTGPGEIDRLS